MNVTDFSARVQRGSGRGRLLGFPTLNLRLIDLPLTLTEGIYAAYVRIEKRQFHAAMHYGPRPVFQDTQSCELYLLDTSLPSPPDRVHVSVVQRLRSIQNFSTPEALQRQIASDIQAIRAILQ